MGLVIICVHGMDQEHIRASALIGHFLCMYLCIQPVSCGPARTHSAKINCLTITVVDNVTD